MHRQPVFAGKVEVALVVRRAAEDGAGAVFHQHEIGDDRPAAARAGRAGGRLPAGVDSRAFRPPRSRPRWCRRRSHSAMNSASAGIIRRQLLRQRMMRRQRHERGAEQRVRPGREDLDRVVATDNVRTARVRLRIGRSSSAASAGPSPASGRASSSASSNSSANSVMRRNHCASLRFSTTAPLRQPRPSMTCSLASTVWSTGSQLTQLSLR